MADVSLESVDVEFPIYEVRARRLIRTDLLRSHLGGEFGVDRNDRVVVKALKNLDLQIKHGDRVGLIGHNGAGKTTLLRVLAGIYHPTRGKLNVNGRISPLFDIALGMELDATGYENINILGMLLGMSRVEIKKAIPGIEAFTGLREYLSLPVRTYSAGMQMRLAFGLVTSVTPDIVLLDEAIGTGDASFHHKMQERLNAFLSQSSILVLASHSEDLLRQFCNRALVMDAGAVTFDGPIDQALAIYQASVSSDPQ